MLPSGAGRDGTAFVSARGAVSHSDLAAYRRSPLPSSGFGEAVVLHLKDPLSLAMAAAVLGGRVRRLFLLSYDTEAEVARDLLERFSPDVVVTDETAGLSGLRLPVRPWSELEQDLSKALASDASPAEPSACETEWVLATSGTTGSPKLVAHQFRSLTRTVSKRAGDHPHRWGQLFNMCRFAGIQVFLQGLLSGGSILLPRLDWSLEEQIAFLSRHGCTALSATPTLWRKILMTPESRSLDLAQVTLGGEIVDDPILQSLRARFPAARIVHIYASTEAGAAFSVSDGRAGFPQVFLDEPPRGIALKVANDRLFVKNLDVLPHYLGQQDRFADEEGFVDTGDSVQVVGDRCHFLGRANGMINVGGNKLFPEEVEAVLLEHPAVRLARVYGKKSPITGQLVVAEVVPHETPADQPALVRDLSARCRERLERWKAPSSIRIVPDFAVSSGGKIRRNAE